MTDPTQELKPAGTPELDRRMREAVERARALAVVADTGGYVVPPVDTRGGPTDDIAPALPAYPGIPVPPPAPPSSEAEAGRRDPA
jgi:hypothetical protein